MFTAPLQSKSRSADNRKPYSSIVASVRFRKNAFTEPVPSNKLFQHSGVMSQYFLSQQLQI
jgi:hypothetical protein